MDTPTMTLAEIVEQLKFCDYKCVGGDYECEAGLLTRNVAFVALEQMAEQAMWQPISHDDDEIELTGGTVEVFDDGETLTFWSNGDGLTVIMPTDIRLCQRTSLASGFEGQQRENIAAGPQRGRME